MIKLLFNTLSIYLCIRILKNQNYGIGINHSQRHFFYYHTSTPIGSLPVRSRQLLRTMFSINSTHVNLNLMYYIIKTIKAVPHYEVLLFSLVKLCKNIFCKFLCRFTIVFIWMYCSLFMSCISIS